jgi:hypothetical protein
MEDYSGRLEISKSDSTKSNTRIEGEDMLTNSAISTLIGGFLLNFATGASLAFGSLVVYIVSYYRIILEYNVDENTF